MPIISATRFINRSYVLVQANWADVPAATCASVVRVRLDTGEEARLRPYVAPCGVAGEFIETSGGHVIFWDTEAPLDTAFYYRTEAAGVTFPDREIRDSFTRTVVNGWGTSDSLHIWTTLGGSVTDYNVASGVGTISNATVNINRRTLVGTNDITDSDQRIDMAVPAIATGASITAALFSRFLDTANFVRLQVNFNTDSTVSVTIAKTFAGATTTLTTAASGLTYSANEWFSVRGMTRGRDYMIKVWERGTPEPAAWLATASDPDNLAGQLGVRNVLSSGNTNTLPVIISHDNYLAQIDFMGLQTEPLTMPSNGYFWLKDPVRPCNDQRITTNKMLPPDCPPGSGIFFIAIDQEGYASNSSKLGPTNAKRLIQVSRTRRDANTSLVLATRMFSDRDNVLTLNEPGSPLLFQAAPNYGIPDRYMAIDTVSVARGLPDHRYEPRILNMPYDTVDRPVGTSQGICGSRFMDLCDIYQTWDEMATAGLTYESLVMGAASQPSENFNTWNDIEAGFANWNAVEAAFTNWEEVEGGS